LSSATMPIPSSPVHAGSVPVCIRSTAEIPQVLEPVVAEMTLHGYSERDVFGMRLSLEEALVNAIKHGHRHDPNKKVTVRYQINRAAVEVEVEDEGPGFNPNEVPDPLAPENLERDCGRGLLLMRNYMTTVRYNARGNAVSLSRKRSAP
jgi:serine/threonine-protein kinase RsbW